MRNDRHVIEGFTWTVERVRSMFVVRCEGNRTDCWEFDAPAYDGALPEMIGEPDDTDEYWSRVAQEAVLRTIAGK